MPDVFTRIKERFSEDELREAEEHARLYRELLGPEHQTDDEAVHDCLLAMYILGKFVERAALDTLAKKYAEQQARADEWQDTISG